MEGIDSVVAAQRCEVQSDLRPDGATLRSSKSHGTQSVQSQRSKYQLIILMRPVNKQQ